MYACSVRNRHRAIRRQAAVLAVGFLAAAARAQDPRLEDADLDFEKLAQVHPDAVNPQDNPRGACSGNPLNLMYPFSPAPPWALVNFAGGSCGCAGCAGADERNDDDHAFLALPFTFQFYGVNYNAVYINNNGNITFGAYTCSFNPLGFPSASVPPMIAPFWADVDTRNLASGRVWYRFLDSNGDALLDTLVITWQNVGYYNSHADLQNTFQLVMSNGTNPLMGIGRNVCFDYDNMCWAAGDIQGPGGFPSPPTNGPATVGINRGDGVDYFQIGRFGIPGTAYDGPFGAVDGVSYLDGRRFCFNTGVTNVPPVPDFSTPNDSITVVAGQSLNHVLGFLSPEPGQTTGIINIDDLQNAQAAGLSISTSAGNVAHATLSWNTDCADVGVYVLRLTARDNFNPPGFTTADFQIIVTPATTVPTVAITDPTTLECLCNPSVIHGSAFPTGGDSFGGYTLEYAANPNGPWTVITSSSVPVTNSTLGVWNTTGVPQGYYYLRLRAHNECGPDAALVILVFVDQQFDSVVLRRPLLPGSIIGGNDYCIDGTVTDYCFRNYRVEFAPPPFASYSPVDPSNPIYFAAVVNDPIASWDTASGPGSVPDGDYRLRVTGLDTCGHTAVVMRDVTVDNTPPVARITSPSACGYVAGIVPVSGIVNDLHLAGWTLQYTGGNSSNWVTIASGSSNISGVLANWNTTGLRRCAYTLRLIATDQSVLDCNDASRNQTEFEVSVIVGCAGDIDLDGDVDLNDLTMMLAGFGLMCP